MKSPKHIFEISNTRLAESVVLEKNGYYDGAFYLAGYSVELALKAKICILLDIPNLYDESFLNGDKRDLFKSYKSHNLDHLILLSGLRSKFDFAKSNNADLQKNWNFVAETWNEKCRYYCCGTTKKEDCQRLIAAISDTKNGILTWIQTN